MTPPLLMTLHPSAFVVGDPSFESYATHRARSHGFEVWNLRYPLGDLTEQLSWTATVARMAARKTPAVYAYGDSAGATLASRLLQRKLVKAAASFSPVANVWDFLNEPGVAWVEEILQATEAEANMMSPALHAPAGRQNLVIAAVDDTLSPVQSLRDWDAADPKITLREVPGPHLGGGPPDPLYMEPMKAAIDWLSYAAWIQSGTARRTLAPVPAPVPAPLP